MACDKPYYQLFNMLAIGQIHANKLQSFWSSLLRIEKVRERKEWGERKRRRKEAEES